MKMCVCLCFPLWWGWHRTTKLNLSLSAQRVFMTLGCVRHDKCLNLTKIASHMSNVPVVSSFVWSRSSSCPLCSYDSNVFPSFPTVLTVFHLFSHSKGLEKNKKETLDTQGWRHVQAGDLWKMRDVCLPDTSSPGAGNATAKANLGLSFL